MKIFSPIFTNAIGFWAVKLIIMMVIYFWLVAPYLTDSDPVVINFINIAYAFLTVFVVFALRSLNIPGFISIRK